MVRTIAMMVALAMAAPAAAQMGAPAPCPTPTPPPAAFAGWDKPAPLAEGATLTVGRAATLALSTTARFATTPGHAPKPGSFGGTLRFVVASAGTYRVGLGAGVWIDVVQGGTPLASVAHDHGPACSPVRKIVDFALTPGTYALQVSGSVAPSVSVMVVKAG